MVFEKPHDAAIPGLVGSHWHTADGASGLTPGLYVNLNIEAWSLGWVKALTPQQLQRVRAATLLHCP